MGGGKDERMKKVLAACKDKEAEAACSYEIKDGVAKEGTCVVKKDTLWCKAGGGGGKDERMKKVVAACKDKEAEAACSYEIKDNVTKEGTCVVKKDTLWCKAGGGGG